MNRRAPGESLPIVVMILLMLSQAPDPRASNEEPANPEKPRQTILHIEILDEESEKPIKGAEVFVKSKQDDVEFEKTMETNSNGLASFSEVPRVKLKIQVTVGGWKTFGAIYRPTTKEEKVTYTLKRPSEKPPDGDATSPTGR